MGKSRMVRMLITCPHVISHIDGNHLSCKVFAVYDAQAIGKYVSLEVYHRYFMIWFDGSKVVLFWQRYKNQYKKKSATVSQQLRPKPLKTNCNNNLINLSQHVLCCQSNKHIM